MASDRILQRWKMFKNNLTKMCSPYEIEIVRVRLISRMKKILVLAAVFLGTAVASRAGGIHIDLPLPPLPSIIIGHPAPRVVYETRRYCPPVVVEPRHCAPPVVVAPPRCAPPRVVYATPRYSHSHRRDVRCRDHDRCHVREHYRY
jgi:hypothetical protein